MDSLMVGVILNLGVGAIYLGVAVAHAIGHKWGWSLAYFSYAIANVGLSMAMLGK